MLKEFDSYIKYFYDKPGRKYHNASHIRQVFKSLEEVAGVTDWEKNIRLGLLVVMHDAYYIPGYDLNEFESVCLATKIFPEYSNYLTQGILATRNHKLDEVSDQFKREISLFLDADMSILAADEKEYLEYSNNVRDEYLEAGVSLEYYNRGRLKFLESFSGFITPEYQKLNNKALNNLNKERLRILGQSDE